GPKDLAEEALLLGLRTTTGIDLDGFRARFGADLLAANGALVARLVDEGRVSVGRGPDGARRASGPGRFARAGEGSRRRDAALAEPVEHQDRDVDAGDRLQEAVEG